MSKITNAPYQNAQNHFSINKQIPTQKPLLFSYAKSQHKCPSSNSPFEMDCFVVLYSIWNRWNSGDKFNLFSIFSISLNDFDLITNLYHLKGWKTKSQHQYTANWIASQRKTAVWWVSYSPTFDLVCHTTSAMYK